MSNKVMLIVGVGPGISLSTTKKFGKEGFKIAMIARREEALKQYEKQLTHVGIEAKGFQADASSQESLTSAIESVIKFFGKVDVLLYNAASGTAGSPTELNPDDLVDDFKISVAGALTSVRETLPHMQNGSILLTGGGLALHPYSELASLSIGKAGLRNLTHSLHQELNPKGIYVGTMTIKGFVQEGTYYSADKIAEEFYRMYLERKDVEVIYEEQ